jgi:hypothetical protein
MDPGTFSNVVSRGELSAVTQCQSVVTRTKITTDFALHTVSYRIEQHTVFLTFYTPLIFQAEHAVGFKVCNRIIVKGKMFPLQAECGPEGGG